MQAEPPAAPKGILLVLAWEGQIIAGRLSDAAHQVRRIPKPTGTDTGAEQTEDEPRPVTTEHPHSEDPTRRDDRRAELTTASSPAAGAALTVSTRLTDALLGVPPPTQTLDLLVACATGTVLG